MVKICELYEKAGICALPVSPAEAAASAGVKTVSYSAVSEVYRKRPEELYRESRFGFSFLESGGRLVIAVNDHSCGERRRRFTIAHELGHCLLGHIENGRILTSADERAADIFAADLLAPLCVLDLCGVTCPEEISRMCRISRKAAEIRFEELQKKRIGCSSLEDEDNIRIIKRFSRYITSRVSVRTDKAPFYRRIN